MMIDGEALRDRLERERREALKSYREGKGTGRLQPSGKVDGLAVALRLVNEAMGIKPGPLEF
jgi:hypothetical protein